MSAIIWAGRLCLLVFGLALSALNTAVAQDSSLLLGSKLSLIDNEKLFGEFSGEKTQRVIANGETLTGINSTLSRISAPRGFTGRYVTTANYGKGASAGAKVQGLTIDGRQTNYAADGKSDTHAVALDSLDGTIEFCRIHRFRGTLAMSMTSLVEGASPPGSSGPFSRAAQIRFCELMHGHVGIETGIPDTRITGNMVAGCRDYGLVINPVHTSCQSSFNHYYGMQKAAALVGAGNFTSTQDEFADARIGAHVNSVGWNASFVNAYSQHCWHRNFLLEAQSHILGGKISVAQSDDAHSGVIGVEIAAAGVAILGTQFDSDYYQFKREKNYRVADAAIRINDGVNNVTIRDVRLDGRNAVGKQTGILVAGKTAGTVIDVVAQEYDEPGDVAVKVFANTIKGCTITVRGPTQDYLTIPAGWDDSNVITLINTTTGAKKVLKAGEPHPTEK